MGALHRDQYTLFIISLSILLRTGNFSGKFVHKIETQILCSVTFFSEYRTVYEI